MRCWAINENLFNKQDLAIIVESRRKVSIAKHDKVILFKRIYADVNFISYGSISSVQIDDREKDNYIYKAYIEEISKFDNVCNLTDFSYSLLKVYRINDPSRHFRRAYLRLNENDFNTLVSAKIFWARTAFGFFFNKLPSIAQMKFIVKLINLEPNVLLKTVEYKKVWQVLHTFIIEEYVATAKIFTELHRQIQEFETSSNQDLHFDKLYLSSDDAGDNPNSISKQKNLFSEFMKSLHIEDFGDLFNELKIKMDQEHDTEQKYEDTFRGKPWPVEMI